MGLFYSELSLSVLCLLRGVLPIKHDVLHELAPHGQPGKRLAYHVFLFAGFDNTCDLSSVLGILERASIFVASAISSYAKDVRSKVRNEWGHCNFDHWTDPEFKNCYVLLENLLRSLKLPSEDEAKVLDDLRDWKKRGK